MRAVQGAVSTTCPGTARMLVPMGTGAILAVLSLGSPNFPEL
jgi:hypothetical protein